MNKKLKVILIFACIAAMSALFAACSTNPVFDKYANQGYSVIVTFNGNGGRFVGKEGNEVVELYDPSKYTADENGLVHISLTDPTQKAIGGETGTLTKSGYFIGGWYRERTLVTNSDGAPVDIDGNVLTEEDGFYYDADGKVATPQYDYDGYWDYSADTIDCKADGKRVEMTLYACWVPYYEFNYYYLNGEEWTLVKNVTFDYKINLERGLNRDVVWLPQYDNGAMTYEHSYSVVDAEGKTVSYTYEFPYIEDTTFDKAYFDSRMTEEISDSQFSHKGTFDFETGTPVDRVQNIYFTAKQGTYYKIDSAAQLVANIDYSGNYEITADLDFTGIRWPDSFVMATFNGKMYSTEGSNFKISNVNARFNSGSSAYGGLFGRIGEDAEISNLTFENVTIDYVSCSSRMRGAYFGLFAGYIEDGASIENVTVGGVLTMRINGQLSLERINYTNLINVFANGEKEGLTRLTDTSVVIYGAKSGFGEYTTYNYAFDPETVQLLDDDTIEFRFGDYSLSESEYVSVFVSEFDEQEENGDGQ